MALRWFAGFALVASLAASSDAQVLRAVDSIATDSARVLVAAAADRTVRAAIVTAHDSVVSAPVDPDSVFQFTEHVQRMALAGLGRVPSDAAVEVANAILVAGLNYPNEGSFAVAVFSEQGEQIVTKLTARQLLSFVEAARRAVRFAKHLPLELFSSTRPVQERPPQIISLDVAYPAVPRAQGKEGEVRVQFFVQEDGSADMKTLKITSSTDPVFEQAVRDALLRLRARPAAFAGRAVRALVELPVTFRINDPNALNWEWR